MRVLLVDNSGPMRTIQRRCLNKLGVEDIVEAENGRQALELFETETFDIVLSDWNMPHMDGHTMLKEFRQRSLDVPIVMITTEAERARVATAIQTGCSDYLVKPFSPDGLKNKLKKWATAGVPKSVANQTSRKPVSVRS